MGPAQRCRKASDRRSKLHPACPPHADADADAFPALSPFFSPTTTTTTGARLDADGWLREYDGCKALTAEVVQLVQERNMNHPQGGPEASRLTASARRKLGLLGATLDALVSWLDGPEASEL